MLFGILSYFINYPTEHTIINFLGKINDGIFINMFFYILANMKHVKLKEVAMFVD
jgi:hypothetical protein